MISIWSLVKTRGYKLFMSKVYGWGASVVMIGALFKIQHYYGAGLMLCIGLGTEALIFFFSGFEPAHVEPDWSLVYPELAGMYHNEAEVEELGLLKKPVTEELDNLLQEAKIGPELIDSLGQGLKKLSDTTAKLSDVSNASMATNDYVKNMQSASKSANELSDTYKKANETLYQDINVSNELANNIKNASKSASDLSNAYTNTSKQLTTNNEQLTTNNEQYLNSIKAATNSVNDLAQKYASSSEILTKSALAMDFSAADNKAYLDKIQTISKNLAALNSVYELQLKSSNDQVQTASKLQEQMNKFINNINDSIEFTSRYKDQAALLTQNISALNNIYGNMLAAMNVNIKK